MELSGKLTRQMTIAIRLRLSSIDICYDVMLYIGNVPRAQDYIYVYTYICINISVSICKARNIYSKTLVNANAINLKPRLVFSSSNLFDIYTITKQSIATIHLD